MSASDGIAMEVLEVTKTHALIRETYDLRHPRCPMIVIDWVTMTRRSDVNVVVRDVWKPQQDGAK